MKKIFFIIIMTLAAYIAEAQVFRIHLKNGQKFNYSLEQIDFLDFVEHEEDNDQPGTNPDDNPGTNPGTENQKGHNQEPYFSETVELMSLLWRLAGSPEYCMCNVLSVAQSADTYFASMRNHEAVKLARNYSNQNIVYDAVTGYANQLIFDGNGSIIFDPDYQEGSNSSFDRWSKQQKTAMLTAVNDFYKQSNFHEWFMSIEAEKKQAIKSFKQICNLNYDWFDTYYGKNDKLSSRIILSFLLGPNNNGISLKRNDGTLLLTPTLGSLSGNGNSINFGGDISTIVHEFSHPYCNPLIEKNWAAISKKAEEIFPRVSSIMQSQAYSNALTMMCETLVRVSEIQYLKNNKLAYRVESAIRYEESMGFMLVRPIVETFKKRDQNSSLYPTLESFMPEIIETINSYDIDNPDDSGNQGNENVTPPDPGSHEYVDLDIMMPDGRKLYFATMNVGETSPAGFGSESYRWGATQSYGPEWANPDDFDATWPEGHTLDKEHDICSIEWGGDWKTPTRAHWEALMNQCDYEFVDASTSGYNIDGVIFYNVADHSKKIFLPSSTWDAPHVKYWTSEIHGQDSNFDVAYTFNSWPTEDNQRFLSIGEAGTASTGFASRPVIEANGSFDANGHDYVDLGIVVDGKNIYFSKMDVGATEVGEIGIYYRWGATYLNGEEWACPEASHNGWPIGKRLDVAHDIATILWGGGWHTPSNEEWNMLVEQCDYERKEADECIYGVAGYFFYKKTDHNTFIFLPVSSWDNELEYWTSEITTPYMGYVSAGTFNSINNQAGTFGSAGIENTGFAVRPVFVK